MQRFTTWFNAVHGQVHKRLFMRRHAQQNHGLFKLQIIGQVLAAVHFITNEKHLELQLSTLCMQI